MPTYKSFEELDCYKKCRDLRVWIYNLLKEKQIRDRDINQNLKRAARSTTRNIAEGFGRHHFKENIQYLRISIGSCHEILEDLNIIEDEEFASKSELEKGRTLSFQALKSESVQITVSS